MAYDPETDTDTDIDPGGDQTYSQDYQDQLDRQGLRRAAGLDTAAPPPTLRQTAPGVYSPYPAPEPAEPPAGLSRAAPRFNPHGKVTDDPTAPSYQMGQPEPAPPEGGDFGGDLVRYGMTSLRGWGQDILGAGKFLNDQLVGSSGINDYLDGYYKSLGKANDASLDGMSPTRRNAARASILRTFGIGPDTDEQGNHIPSPFENGIGGFGDYLAQRIASVAAPVAALFMLPEEGVAATASAALLFGTATAGQVYNTLADAIAKKPDADYQKDNESYRALRGSGLSERDAKTQVLNGSWASILGAFFGGAASGVGFGKVIAPSATAGFLASRGIGAAEGAATMGLQSGVTNVGTQTGLMQTKLQKEFDTEGLAREVAEGTIGGAAFGAAVARRRPSEVVEPSPRPDVDPAASAALAAASPEPTGPRPGQPTPGQQEMFVPSQTGPTVAPSPLSEPPAPERTAQPPAVAPLSGTTRMPGPEERTPGPYAPQPASYAMGPEGPTIVSRPEPGMPGAAQNEMFAPAAGVAPEPPPTPPTPPTPPAPPPTAPAATTAAVVTSKGKAAAAPPKPTTQAPAAGTTAPVVGTGPRSSVRMTKTALDDALTGMGIDTKGMSRNDMANRFDREQARAPSIEAPPVTTVVTGAVPGSAPPAGEQPPARAETQAAPPAPGTSLPSAPEGVPQPLTAESTTGVRPAGEPAPEVRPTSAQVSPEAQGELPIPPAAAEAVAVSKSGRKKRVVVTPEKPTTAPYVAEPTRGTRAEQVAQQRAAAEHAAQTEQARDEASTKVREAWDRALADVVPLRPGDPAIRPALAKATRAILDRVNDTDGTMQLVSHAIHDFASTHPGDIPGTDVAWADIAGKVHHSVTGKSLEGTGFAREMAGEVGRQAHVADTEKERGSIPREELSAREAAEAHTEAPGERVAAPVEGVEAKAAEHAAETGAHETTSGTMASQLANVTAEEAAPKHPSVVRRAAYYVRKLLAREMPAEVADREFSKQAAVGKERTKGYGSLHEVFSNLLKHAEDRDAEQAVIDKFAADMDKPGLTPQGRSALRKKLERDLAQFGDQHAEELRGILRRLSDPVGAVADESQNLAARAALKGKMAERTPDIPLDAPLPEGISPRSSRYVTGSADPRLGANYEAAFGDRIRGAGEPVMAREAAQMIAQDPMVRAEQEPLREVAERFANMVPADIPIMSLERAMREGRIQRGLFDDLRARGAYGAYDPESRTILHNIDAPRLTGSHIETALHEMSHAISWHYLNMLERTNKFHPDLRALSAIRGELARHVLSEAKAGRLTESERQRLLKAIANNHEMHTQLFTDPVVHGFAASRTASPAHLDTMRSLGYPGTPGQSVWRSFSNWVRKALGQPPARSASEFTLFDHIIKPVTDIQERAAEYNASKLLPEDPVLRARAQPVYDTIGATMSARGRDLINRADTAGLGEKLRRGFMRVRTRDAIVDNYKDVAPSLVAHRAADENIAAASSDYATMYGDKVQELLGRLNKADDQNNLFTLMTNVGLHNVKVGDGLAADANAHLTTPVQLANLHADQAMYNRLSAKDKALYNDERDHLAQRYKTDRAAEVEGLLNAFVPDATAAERAAFTTDVKTMPSLERFLADPENSRTAAAFGEKWADNRGLLQGMARLHNLGFVQGDYFPLDRFGNFVVRAGDREDLANYTVRMFDSYTKAQQYRTELARTRDDVHQVARKDTSNFASLAPKPAFADELAHAMGRRGYGDDQIAHIHGLMNEILLKHATQSERARQTYQRRGVLGASTDQPRVLAADYASAQARYGNTLHGLERARQLDNIYNEAKAHEQPSGTPGAAVQAMDVYQELSRRQLKEGESDNLLHKLGSYANGFTFARALASPSLAITHSMETLANSLSLIGSRHGYGATTMAIQRALRDAVPVLAKGGSNTIKALTNQMKSSDWNVANVVFDKMIAASSGRDRQLLVALKDAVHRSGIIDHTVMKDIYNEINPKGAVGGVARTGWNIFYNTSTAMLHSVDALNRIASAVAAGRLELRRSDATIESATDYAMKMTRRVMPNYTAGNREAISRGPIMRTLMQFKRYGVHMYNTMATLTYEATHGDKAERWEAAKGLAGIMATHAALAGVITLIADPLRYIGGLYDIATTGGTKFVNREPAVRGFLTETFGPVVGEILARGLPHWLFGGDVHLRTGLANMFEMPEMDGFNKKGAGQVLLGLTTGATGENLEQEVDAVGKLMQGDFWGAAQGMVPRVFRDVMKAVDLESQGIKASTGKTMLPASKVTARDVFLQGIGIQPSAVTETREAHNAILQAQEIQRAEHTRLVNSWLTASPTDRAAIQSQINRFNADPMNLGARIKQGDLLRTLNQRRKDELQAGGFGLRLPRRGAQQLIQQGAFANVP